MSFNLIRSAARVSSRNPARITSRYHRRKLGSYPVPPEQAIWWKNRFQVPGGEIRHSMDPLQQKIMWEYFWNFPTRWYNRGSEHLYPVIVLALPFILLFEQCKHGAEESIRAEYWY